MDADRLTEHELAERSGTSRERIKRLVDQASSGPIRTRSRAETSCARVVTHLDARGSRPRLSPRRWRPARKLSLMKS